MINEIFKNPTVININYNMICSIKSKFTDKIAVGDYIIERIVREKIYCGFGYKSENINKLNKYADNHKKFNIVENYIEQSSGYSAFTYSIINKKPGIIVTNSEDGFKNLLEPVYKNYVSNNPLLLISLYKDNNNKESLIEKYMIESYNMNTTHRFPHIFDYLLLKSMDGPVHLKINNNILSENIDLNLIQYNIKM